MRKVKPKVRLVVLGAIILALGAIAIGLAFRPDAEKDLKANGDDLFEPIVGNPGFEGEPPPQVRRNFPDGEFRGADFYPRAKARIRSNRVNVRRLATLNTGSIARLSEGTVVEVVDRIDSSEDGYIWYKVVLPESDRQGWVRGDLLTQISD
ncbi:MULTISPECIES: SH3 domain-containing protein [Arthrospira]|uniref:SH3 domain-containing protein n=1 Tax=Oscillatoriales TaxID=1150 RepID=UPI0001D0E699|nr:SH3 domain-containing protein [Arthrospira platensis]AMW29153.1 peptide-binding protein [Arthrospira platensis YZ]KDR57301.1 peptide-binding protein [Arthrospira platensis str. Paraca]MBD2711317.1 SH3 domain-containing protein [Arthrospira platensis FACHB-835]MDF2213009.1 SH3 domain-containing protein [Arthrospira platensis NCB002]MDT9312271.1 SH3 domain-containing protein [Limnospira sp. Paracas R14]QQW27028.1 SH3 domain-containing protein [Arthrospira sp. PCC 9108]BAI91337.1 SH3 type 3 